MGPIEIIKDSGPGGIRIHAREVGTFKQGLSERLKIRPQAIFGSHPPPAGGRGVAGFGMVRRRGVAGEGHHHQLAWHQHQERLQER